MTSSEILRADQLQGTAPKTAKLGVSGSARRSPYIGDRKLPLLGSYYKEVEARSSKVAENRLLSDGFDSLDCVDAEDEGGTPSRWARKYVSDANEEDNKRRKLRACGVKLETKVAPELRHIVDGGHSDDRRFLLCKLEEFLLEEPCESPRLFSLLRPSSERLRLWLERVGFQDGTLGFPDHITITAGKVPDIVFALSESDQRHSSAAESISSLRFRGPLQGFGPKVEEINFPPLFIHDFQVDAVSGLDVTDSSCSLSSSNSSSLNWPATSPCTPLRDHGTGSSVCDVRRSNGCSSSGSGDLLMSADRRRSTSSCSDKTSTFDESSQHGGDRTVIFGFENLTMNSVTKHAISNNFGESLDDMFNEFPKVDDGDDGDSCSDDTVIVDDDVEQGDEATADTSMEESCVSSPRRPVATSAFCTTGPFSSDASIFSLSSPVATLPTGCSDHIVRFAPIQDAPFESGRNALVPTFALPHSVPATCRLRRSCSESGGLLFPSSTFGPAVHREEELCSSSGLSLYFPVEYQTPLSDRKIAISGEIFDWGSSVRANDESILLLLSLLSSQESKIHHIFRSNTVSNVLSGELLYGFSLVSPTVNVENSRPQDSGLPIDEQECRLSEHCRDSREGSECYREPDETRWHDCGGSSLGISSGGEEKSFSNFFSSLSRGRTRSLPTFVDGFPRQASVPNGSVFDSPFTMEPSELRVPFELGPPATKHALPEVLSSSDATLGGDRHPIDSARKMLSTFFPDLRRGLTKTNSQSKSSPSFTDHIHSIRNVSVENEEYCERDEDS